MDVPRLMHVRVNVSDFERSVTWYESVLGLTAGTRKLTIRDPDGNELGFVRD